MDLPELTEHDRCDGCGAQALASAQLRSGGLLLFCADHWEQHRDVILLRASSYQGVG